MRIATWNVNSVRARMERLLPWLEEHRPEVVCLQETKVVDELFPREPLEDLGYQVETFGQKTYNGVAILSSVGMEDVVRGLPESVDPRRGDGERRVIGATVAGVMLLNVYVVNGQSVGSQAFEHKLAWLGRLREFVSQHYPMREQVVLTGDFNVTFDDRDVWDPEAWRERILCSTPEREALGALLECGLSDALRALTDEGGIYTWWDFRTGAFRRGRGLRIDHFLMSPPALARCRSVEVDLAARAGPRPSDHAPVIATLAD